MVARWLALTNARSLAVSISPRLTQNRTHFIRRHRHHRNADELFDDCLPGEELVRASRCEISNALHASANSPRARCSRASRTKILRHMRSSDSCGRMMAIVGGAKRVRLSGRFRFLAFACARKPHECQGLFVVMDASRRSACSPTSFSSGRIERFDSTHAKAAGHFSSRRSRQVLRVASSSFGIGRNCSNASRSIGPGAIALRGSFFSRFVDLRDIVDRRRRCANRHIGQIAAARRSDGHKHQHRCCKDFLRSSVLPFLASMNQFRGQVRIAETVEKNFNALLHRYAILSEFDQPSRESGSPTQRSTRACSDGHNRASARRGEPDREAPAAAPRTDSLPRLAGAVSLMPIATPSVPAIRPGPTVPCRGRAPPTA